MARVPSPKSTVPSTTSLRVGLISPVHTLNGRSEESLTAGRPGVLALEMEGEEDDPFVHEMRSTSISSSGATSSVVVLKRTETLSVDSSKGLSEATISLEAKETKRRGRTRKEQKNARRSHAGKYVTTRRRY